LVRNILTMFTHSIALAASPTRQAAFAEEKVADAGLEPIPVVLRAASNFHCTDQMPASADARFKMAGPHPPRELPLASLLRPVASCSRYWKIAFTCSATAAPRA
jgi:hypothetical protein